MSRPGKPTPKRKVFPFTGMIRCGECGLMVTAEDKVNRYGKQYRYYHCTKRRLDRICRQRSVTEQSLDETFEGFLASLIMPPGTHQWLIDNQERTKGEAEEHSTLRVKSIEEKSAETTRAISNLTSLRIRDMIDDEEFSSRRQELDRERIRIEENLRLAGEDKPWFEHADVLVLFCNRAVAWYRAGDPQIKRQIVNAVGSNLILMNKKVFIEARKPFVVFSKNDSCSARRAHQESDLGCRFWRPMYYHYTMDPYKQDTRWESSGKAAHQLLARGMIWICVLAFLYSHFYSR